MSVLLTVTLQKSLRDSLQTVERGILGGVKTWEEYQLLVGKRQGLLIALNVVDEAIEQFDKQDS